MNKERMAYIAPTSELLVVRFEQGFLTGSDTMSAPSFGERGSINDQSDAEDWW